MITDPKTGELLAKAGFVFSYGKKDYPAVRFF